MGFAEYNSEQVQHGASAVTVTDYLGTGHLWEALFRNRLDGLAGRVPSTAMVAGVQTSTCAAHGNRVLRASDCISRRTSPSRT